MHTYFNCGKAKERVMLRVHELDKEMSGEDRFHLENISFHLPKGYICGLVGENGAGKTTLLRCLMGLYRSTGDIVIDGHNLNSDEAAAREVIAVVGD
jgi:ABC-2 type transport system ATP-binding protein